MSGHLDGPPPGPPDPPYIPGDLGAPSAEEFARRRASSEPRPENPKVTAWYAASPSTFPSGSAACPCELDEAPDGQYVLAAAFDAVVAERDVATAALERIAECYDDRLGDQDDHLRRVEFQAWQAITAWRSAVSGSSEPR